MLAVDDAMRAYFGSRIARRSTDAAKLRALVSTIIAPDGLHFTYDAAGTFTARDTFQLRRGNCASYAFLVAAVARDFGFDVAFQNIRRATRWTHVGDIVVVVQHLDLRIRTDDGTYIVDLEPDLIPPPESDAMQVISDERASAQFYCNVGFEHLVSGHTVDALRYFELATRVDPGCPTAWSNLATLHARVGDLLSARAAFERSLRADPDGEACLDGFVHVLRQLGTPDDLRRAAKLERRAQSVRDHNPYYQQHLARRAQAEGQLDAAEKLLRRAIRLKDDEPEFYVDRIAVLEQLGRSDDARRLGQQLERLRRRLAAVSPHLSP